MAGTPSGSSTRAGQDSTPAVEVSALTKFFGNFQALRGLDLVVRTGEVHGFLGPNGAGKSATIRVLLGMYRPSGGTVRVLGLEPHHHAAEVTRQISYVPGDVALWPNLTGQQALDALAGLRQKRRPRRERELIDAFELDPTKAVRTYSKGNRQKVALVAAFSAPTPMLVLDEPTTGLDPLMEEIFQDCVTRAAAEGRTVLLSSHILAEVDRLCERVTIIKDGVTVETGRIADLRHLSSARITATLTTALAGVSTDATGHADVAVPTGDVNDTLRRLINAGATEITCTPASLDELFLRHYTTATA
ncbi:MAG: ABC transporter ATP-binding protein [Terracoccus sp.]